MRALGLALLLLLFPLCLSDGPVPYVMRNTVKAKPIPPRPHTDSECVASAIYHEARGEPLEGQRAVYEVIMHRAKTLRMSLCAVVKAPKQFSWYGEPNKPIMPLTRPLQDLLKRVKSHPKVLEGISVRWFFSGEAVPKWAVNMDCRWIGGHRFCKEGDKNNGSTGEVRDSGTSPEEVTKHDYGSRLHDI